MATDFPRRLSSVTRHGVLQAIDEFDSIGREAFLAKYGFGKAKKYLLWHEGKPYDSKAILGAAFSYLPGSPSPLKPEDFSGGYLYAVPALKKLGFSFEIDDVPTEVAKSKKNPLWTRDQVILALELYVKHNGRDPGVRHPDVIEVSALLRQMATEAGLQTYRNPSGVIMKMMNFRSLDPVFTSKGGCSATNRMRIARQSG
ncbi:hypothetical protein [Novosphingobium sp. KA1]|uniref:hypothetical protein n=1 Tax=Novosphingobium sp. (strain KA1) TaxID=164608 RepID=UPI001A8C4999|nr:hypothetical protein [Novosphingobium sp. KA1]QSR16520.1 hypothetical protein CA833_04870 [Novosphingobium sp. KA1]